MTFLEKYQHLAQALGWTLVHSLWQIALIYAFYRLLSRLAIKSNLARYYACLLAMATCLGWSMLTFTALYKSSLEGAAAPGSGEWPGRAVIGPLSTNALYWPATTTSGWSLLATGLESCSAALGWLWCLGALFFSLRLTGGYWLSHRLRSRCRSAADPQLAALGRSLARRLGIRRSVRILENPFIRTPLTLGFWQPVVLFPIGLALQLQPAQVEALLLHELAHIRRYDYLINLLQVLLEICFFHHPLFRLLAREASLRREYACDDLVLQHGSSPWLYASTLTEIKLQSPHNQPTLIMSAIGKSHFSARIRRIRGFGPKEATRNLPLCLFLLLVGGLIATCWPLVSQATGDLSASSGNVDIKPVFIGQTYPATRDTVAPGALIRPSAVGLKVRPAPLPSSEVVVEMSNRRVLYIGLDNPLRILAAGVPAGEILVKLIGPGNLQGHGVDYTVQVTTPGEVSIAVYRRQKNQESLLQQLTYQVKNIPDPKPLFAGLSSRKITIDELLLHPVLTVQFDKVEFDVPYTFVSYELTTLPKNGDPITHAVYNTTLPEALIAEINQLPPGSSIFMDDIKIKCAGDTEIRNLGGLAFKIKD